MESNASKPGLSGASLAILTPRWGTPSETFIRRHVTSILPGRTVAMSRTIADPAWCPDVPLLPIRNRSDFPIDRLARVFGRWRYDRRSRALRDFLKEHQVTTVLGEWLNFSAVWFHNIRDLNLRFFAHAHGYDITRKALRHPWYRILYRRLAHMDGIITFSRLSKERLLGAFPMDPQRVHVIPYGIDVPPAIERREESEIIRCLHVGRMVEKKGRLITLQAFEAAHRDCPRLRLELIGAGPLLEACRRYSRDHGLAEAVTFHEGRPHAFVKDRLAHADMLLLHSVTAASGDEEGLPVAILEGMAHALPVISTLHSGIPEAVLEGQTGRLVTERDRESMTRAILELAGQPALRSRMGLAGRQRVLEHFSADQEIRRLREVLFDENAPSRGVSRR